MARSSAVTARWRRSHRKRRKRFRGHRAIRSALHAAGHFPRQGRQVKWAVSPLGCRVRAPNCCISAASPRISTGNSVRYHHRGRPRRRQNVRKMAGDRAEHGELAHQGGLAGLFDRSAGVHHGAGGGQCRHGPRSSRFAGLRADLPAFSPTRRAWRCAFRPSRSLPLLRSLSFCRRGRGAPVAAGGRLFADCQARASGFLGPRCRRFSAPYGALARPGSRASGRRFRLSVVPGESRSKAVSRGSS